MIDFNLLPPEIKEELRWVKANRSFIGHGLVVVAMVVVFILMLLVIQFYSIIKLVDLEKEINLREENVKAKEVKDLEKEIEDFNNYLKTLSDIQKKHLYFSQVVLIFAENVPEAVQITKLNIDQSEKEEIKTQPAKTASEEIKYQVNVEGGAEKRENLLGFKDSLEDTSCFAKIYFPLSNLVEREDINFRFTGDLNKDFLFKN